MDPSRRRPILLILRRATPFRGSVLLIDISSMDFRMVNRFFGLESAFELAKSSGGR
jgi:hypothetical protein